MSFLWNDKAPTCIKAKSKNVVEKSTEIETSKCQKKVDEKDKREPEEPPSNPPPETSQDGEKEKHNQVIIAGNGRALKVGRDKNVSKMDVDSVDRRPVEKLSLVDVNQ